MIVVTGAYGFIGSYLVGELNRKGYVDVLGVDDFLDVRKEGNLSGKVLAGRMDRFAFLDWFGKHALEVEFVFHLGARTDTTEFDYGVFERLNVSYSKMIWGICAEFGIPLVYASSAATYGDGAFGYGDSDDTLPFRLKPLNPYGVSKNEFDQWALEQKVTPPFWAGMKFFNVYGPGEGHKGRMASVIWHFYHQILNNGTVSLFKSHRGDFGDGGQMRDFVYVKDVVGVLCWMYEGRGTKDEVKVRSTKYEVQSLEFENREGIESGLYNLGTGRARSFNDLALGIFSCLGLKVRIVYVDTPLDIRDKYQYFTEADMGKLRGVGYEREFWSLELGIGDYLEVLLKER